MNELYMYLKDKIKTEYPLYIKIAERFEESYSAFDKLEFNQKRLFLIEMLSVTSTKKANSRFNRFGVKITDRIDRLRFNRIDINNAEFIDTSITGVFTKRTKYEL